MKGVAVFVVIVTATAAIGLAMGVHSASTLPARTRCQRVGPALMRAISEGLHRGRKLTGAGYAVRANQPRRAPWIVAVRIAGKGIGLWATDIAPTTRTVGTGFLQSANSVAWSNSDWGTLGRFPRNYPTIAPPLGDLGFALAEACIH